MKARLKSTGHIIDVYYDRDDPSILVGKSGLHYSKDVLDIIYTPDYWEKLKHQYAGMAMQGILANIDLLMSLANKKAADYPAKYTVAEFAQDCAHALVEKLKEGK